MATVVWLPIVLSVTAALFSTLTYQRVPPRTATRALTITTIGTAAAVLSGLSLAVIGAAARSSALADYTRWCPVLSDPDHRTPAWLGIASAVAVIVGVVRAVSLHRHCNRVTRSLHTGTARVEIIASLEPRALAVPGRPGHIIVTDAMLDLLDEPEQRAVMAHEQAHLDHHHHRPVRLTALAAAAVPLLQPLRARVQFCTERWADEIAASVVGDRRVVARAIAKAALAGASSPPEPTLALAGSGVTARVEALMHPRPRSRGARIFGPVVLGGAIVVAVGGASFLLRHLVELVAHVFL